MKTVRVLHCAFFALLILLCQTRIEAQWKRCGPQAGGNVTSFAVQGSRLFAGTSGNPNDGSQGSGIFLSDDSGSNWRQTNAGLSDTNVLALISEGTNLFASTQSSVIFRSTDRGGTWNALAGFQSSKPVCRFAVIGSILFAATDSLGIFRTTDEGVTWKAANVGLTETNIHSFAVMGSVLFANASYDGVGGVYRTTDSATSWTLARNSVFDIAAIGGDLFAAMFHTVDNGVMVSKDSGVTWGEAEGGGCGVYDVMGAAGTAVFSAHSQNGVSHSTDSGASWIPDNGINGFNAIAALGAYLFVGNADGIFRATVGGQTNAVVEGTNGSSTTAAQIYPNPTTGLITVQGASAKIQHITITNLLGESLIEQSTPGTASLTLDLSKLPAGIYFARFSSGNEVVKQ